MKCEVNSVVPLHLLDYIDKVASLNLNLQMVQHYFCEFTHWTFRLKALARV